MKDSPFKNFSLNFVSLLIILSFSVLQIMRWRIFPQFMDMFYHLSTAWGFIKAGGYSGWDFWQFAPSGRAYIYPPFFHLLLSMLIKLGINPIIIAKIFETFSPVAFLFVIYYFVKRNYKDTLAFFVILLVGASFPFYINLINHIPSTLAIIAGILGLDQLLSRRFFRATLLFALIFYIHIGVSFALILSIVFYSIFNKGYRKFCLGVSICAIILATPLLFKQLISLRFISSIGLNLGERLNSQIKIIEYALAVIGLFLVFRMNGKYLLFSSLFFGSLIFLLYPYRFFSAEGYLPIIFLSATALESLYVKLKNTYLKNSFIVFVFLLFIVSPTVSMRWTFEDNKTSSKLLWGQSAFIGMAFPTIENRGFSDTMWSPKDYLSARDLIEHNSSLDDIIYCSLNVTGICLASISGRATANGLFPEIKASEPFDPFLVSKIFIATRLDDSVWLGNIVKFYNLVKIGENKLFIFYENPFCLYKVNIKKASIPFKIIISIGIVFCLLFWQETRLISLLMKLFDLSKKYVILHKL